MYMSEVLKGNISTYILKQSGILLLGVLLLASFMLIDVYFISQLGSDSLAAVSYATPVMSLLVSLLLGMGAGMVVVVSNAAGSKNLFQLKQYLLSSLSLSLMAGLVLLIILFSGSAYLFRQLGAEGEVLEQLLAYFEVLSLGMFFLSLLVCVTSLARALGNHKLLTYTMLLLVLVNAALDPLLIFGYWGLPRLGIAGAAWATTVAIFVSMWLPLPYLWKALGKNRRSGWQMGFFFHWKRIMAMAFPIILANGLVPLGNTIFVRLLSEFGDASVAAYGAGSRIDMLVILSFTSLTAVLAPFIGHNLGAGEYERAYRGFRYGVVYAVIFGLVAAFAATWFNENISRIFTTDRPVFQALSDYLSIVPWGYAANGFVMISLTTLNVHQRPWWATGVALGHLFLFYLPIAYGATLAGSFFGVLSAYPFSHMLAAAVAYFLLLRVQSFKMIKLEVSG
jgi:putative MATE family efflux protein